jgi:predicted DNA-binding protein (UPF0251 family)
MPRPRKWRMVENHPEVTYFKPQGLPVWKLGEVILPVEGLEALRLADMEKMEHEAAAARMGVSRPTFSRVLSAARSSVAEALVKGRAIRIQGGSFVTPEFHGDGRGPGGRHRRGRGGGGRWGPNR